MKFPTLVIASAAILATVGCASLVVPESSVEPSVKIARNVSDVSVSTAPLSLPNAVRFGILSSTDVAAAELGIRQKENEITIARAGFYPELYANLAPSNDSGIFASASAGVRYTVFDFGERAAQFNGSVAAAKGSQYDLTVEIESAVKKTVESYISVAVENAKVQAANDYVKSVSGFEEGVRGRVEIGVASNVDVNEIETAILKADTALIEANSDRSNAEENLASELGIFPSSVWSISAIRQALKFNSNPQITPNFTNFPRIVSLENKVEEAEYQMEAVSAGLLPRIGLTLGFGADLNRVGGVSGNGFTAGPEISEVISLGGGRNERIRNAEIDVVVAKRRRDEEIRLVRLEAVQAGTSLNASLERVDQRADVLRLTKKTRDVMLGEYEVGTRSLRDLLDTEELIYQARVGLIEAQRQELYDLLRYVMAMNLSSEILYSVPK